MNDNNYQKTYIVRSLIDHSLDEAFYYKSATITFWNVQGYDLNTTPNKLIGVRQDGSEIVIAENLKHNQVIDINDIQDQYEKIKLIFPNTIITKNLDFDFWIQVGLKESGFERVKSMVVDQSDEHAWYRKRNDGTDTSWKFFNSSTFEYSDE